MIHVTVTQEDIDAGKPCDGRNCPIARAVKRATGSSDVIVDGMSIEFYGAEFTPPDVCDRFISAFDSGEPVEPFEFFIMDAPKEPL